MGIYDHSRPVSRILNDIEKTKVKQLCNQYFNCLQDLDFLMKIFVDKGEIDRLWPFEDQKIVAQIKEWLKEKIKE
jgi:hypothetical protein